MRRRPLSLGFVVLAVVTAGALLWLGLDAARTPAQQCDNMAGECLRRRQTAALYLLAVCCAAGAAAALWSAVAIVLRNWSHSRAATIGIATALAAVIAIVGPAGHLDDRFSGWLAWSAAVTGVQTSGSTAALLQER